MDKHLVFVGGGHAHMTALLNLGDFLERGHRVTVIAPSPYHYYSGMGPGMLSGVYDPREIRFHTRKMVEDRGAAFLQDKVVKIDANAKRLHLESGQAVSYDVASFNTGSDVPLDGIAETRDRVVPVKPIINLVRARREILQNRGNTSLRIVVTGGGPAGVEISANLWRLLQDHGRRGHITLIGGDRVLDGVPEKVRCLVMDSLSARGIRVLEGVRTQAVKDAEVTLSDGDALPYDFAFMAVGVKPSTLFKDSGLPTGEDGGLLVNATLQSVAHPELFGGGDCISLEGHRLARVGVYAVRQNPVLHHNLMMALEGRELKPFDPGGSYLLILNMGDGKGVLWKKNWVLNGRLAFWLKDFIDRRFMKKFQVSGELTEPLHEGGLEAIE